MTRENVNMAATSGQVYWRDPQAEPPPRGTKIMALTSGNVAVFGEWRDDSNLVAWTPLPKKRIGTPQGEIQMSARDRQEGGDHYKTMGTQPWDVIDTWPLEQRIGFYRGNALKYVMRMGTKDEAPTEIAKAIHYLEKLMEALKESAAAAPPAPSTQEDWK
jgi:hypothetical protein